LFYQLKARNSPISRGKESSFTKCEMILVFHHASKAGNLSPVPD
jgi:hypothetical protein